MTDHDLAQARFPFAATVAGTVSVVVRVGDVYRKTDPVYAASPASFRDIEVLDSSRMVRPLNRAPAWAAVETAVETATAAPGQRRTLTGPAVENPAAAGSAGGPVVEGGAAVSPAGRGTKTSATKDSAAKAKAPAAPAAAAPSEV